MLNVVLFFNCVACFAPKINDSRACAVAVAASDDDAMQVLMLLYTHTREDLATCSVGSQPAHLAVRPAGLASHRPGKVLGVKAFKHLTVVLLTRG